MTSEGVRPGNGAMGTDLSQPGQAEPLRPILAHYHHRCSTV